MSAPEATGIQAIEEALRCSRERRSALERELLAIEAELEGWAKERHQYGLLHEACDALEELRSLGAAELFWGERPDAEIGGQIRSARERAEVFQSGIREIEARGSEVVGRLRAEEEAAELLEDELWDAREAEELRKLEWVIEREEEPSWREAVMPWARGGEDDRRLRRSLAVACVACLLLGLVFPMVDLPIPERAEVVEVPERLARLIRHERALPPPPPKQEPPKPKVPEETPLLAQESTPAPASEKPPAPNVASRGVLAFREAFSGLAALDASDRLGAQARISSRGEGASGPRRRSMVTTQAPGSSGGIDLAALSRDLGGGGGRIEGVEVGRATSRIGTGGGQGRPVAGGPGSARTDEEIQIVFDRHKAALYRLYNRELRRDPTLRGQMVLRLRIEPDGRVSLCELKATDMEAPQLSARVVSRVLTFDFGAKEDIPAVTILYPIDFLPAT